MPPWALPPECGQRPALGTISAAFLPLTPQPLGLSPLLSHHKSNAHSFFTELRASAEQRSVTLRALLSRGRRAGWQGWGRTLNPLGAFSNHVGVLLSVLGTKCAFLPPCPAVWVSAALPQLSHVSRRLRSAGVSHPSPPFRCPCLCPEQFSLSKSSLSSPAHFNTKQVLGLPDLGGDTSLPGAHLSSWP